MIDITTIITKDFGRIMKIMRVIEIANLTHFSPMFHSYTP